MSALGPEVSVLGPIEIFFNLALLGLGLVVIYLFGYVSAVKTLDSEYLTQRGLKKMWKTFKVKDLEGRERKSVREYLRSFESN